MRSGGVQIHRLIGALMAIVIQVLVGSIVPSTGAPMQIVGFGTICHSGGQDDPTETPAAPPVCPICPICLAAQTAPAILLSSAVIVIEPESVVLPRPELPPPSTAPPSPTARPFRSRAPPTFS